MVQPSYSQSGKSFLWWGRVRSDIREILEYVIVDSRGCECTSGTEKADEVERGCNLVGRYEAIRPLPATLTVTEQERTVAFSTLLAVLTPRPPGANGHFEGMDVVTVFVSIAV